MQGFFIALYKNKLANIIFQGVFMKKILSLILLVVCACLCFVGCNDISNTADTVAKDGDYVLINVESIPESTLSFHV